MAKNVILIPAVGKANRGEEGDRPRRRVAAYARVSTDHEEQQSSYEAQVDYYTRYIQGRGDWEFVGVYADEGISGCSTRHREGFNRMVADAMEGRMDLILTKSVSRFARNTVDSLTTIRKLKERGVECFFEKENIWTFDGRGELLLTIMSSLAQEESRSISENCTWGQRKRFADGRATVPFKRFLGFERGADGGLVVDEGQAAVVRRIYGLFLQGQSPWGIAKGLTKEGIPAPGGGSVWAHRTVRSILSNEKYKGDALLQKVYTVDFLTKKKKVNTGEVPQYYVEGSHEAIVSPEVFDAVQGLLARRKAGRGRVSSVGVLAGKIKCGECGNWYGPKVWHSNDRYRRRVWQCGSRHDPELRCAAPCLEEEALKRLFVRAENLLLRKEGWEEDARRALRELSLLYGMGEGEDHVKGGEEEGPGPFAAFDEEGWRSLVEEVTVYGREDIRFLFRNGTEIRTQV